VYGPFLIVGPLTVMTNWHNEFKKFTPEMPCILYHGARARAHRGALPFLSHGAVWLRAAAALAANA
jgi:SNF2 family DNA or RNA helicase